MMSEVKKYKLIKTYPGSKPLGTVEEVVMYNGMVFTNDASKLYNIYPEFWEEVKEEKLCVPDGTRFKYHADASTVFKIGSTSDTHVVVTWTGSNGTEKSTDFTIYTANESFKNGNWIECKPLFKTNDNIDIFEGDTFYFVASTSWGVGEMVASDIAQARKAIARFSTREAAEKYVDRHKPIYNRVQVNDAILKSLLEYMSDVPKALKYKEVIIKNLQEL